jgi:hypothetical protein
VREKGEINVRKTRENLVPREKGSRTSDRDI